MKPSRVLARIAVASVAVLSLTGCIKLDMNLDVQADNTVDGTMVFAVSKQLSELPGFNADDLGGPLESPAAGKVTSKPYDDGTWVGTEMQFTDVPLAEFGNAEGGDDLTITRVGDQFKVSGSLDMSGDDTATPTEGFDPAALGGSAEIRIRLTFPGEVVSANGTVDGNSVTWTPKFGETLDIAAVANAEPSGSSTTWLLVGGLLVGLLVVGGFLVATMRRRESAAPVPPGSIVPGAELVDATVPTGPVPAGDPVDGGPEADAAPQQPHG